MQVAIIGGGVAGCYCAYRLANDAPDARVELFEASNRIGGRLWSVELTGFDGPPAEMGGQFVASGQRNVCRLIDHLGLPLDRVYSEDRHQYLRGEYLNDAEFEKPEPNRVPYKLREEEKGKSPKQVLVDAIIEVFPEFWDTWPYDTSKKPEDTYNALQAKQHIDGRLLSECGFWNVLSDHVSNEAYDLLLSTIGISSVFSNANALECVWTLLRNIEFGQTFSQIQGGYQKLPLTLLGRASDVTPHLEHRLTKIKRSGEKFALTFESGGAKVRRDVDAVILALPRLALKAIKFDETVIENAKGFQKDLDAVISTPGSRVYLTFEKPWWAPSKAGPNALGPREIATAYTDLPMRQCQYFGKPEGRSVVLMMGACTDDIATSYWQGLAEDTGKYPNPATTTDDQDVGACPNAIAESARRQLSEMHEDTDAPVPLGALYVDWGREPHGAAWHEWAPNRKSWVVGPRVQKPNSKLDLFICGEAYSQRQGWVEGAVTTAEAVMVQMGLKTAEWLKGPDASPSGVGPSRQQSIGGENGMQNSLLDLVMALSDNLSLQRAYGRDPEAIMRAYCLSEAEKAALRANDLNAISSMAGGVGMFNTIITIKKPCPKP